MNYPLPLGFGRAPGPCMCGATDCQSCGPAQGCRVFEDDDDEFDIDLEVERLMEGEYSPFDGKNLSEAIGEMSPFLLDITARSVRDDRAIDVLHTLKKWSVGYWKIQARKHAIKTATEALGYCCMCGGKGCVECLWKRCNG